MATLNAAKPAQRTLYTVEEVKRMLAEGRRLLLAGEESLLAGLPRGEWIGGTIPYFMSEDGGVETRQRIFVSELPKEVESVSIATYDEHTISRIVDDVADNGFTVVIMPASSKVHTTFALDAPKWQAFARRPMLGWVSGVHLNDLGRVTPKVFSGTDARGLDGHAVALHARLIRDKAADVGLVNLFQQGDGDVITFAQDGFKVKEARINGKPQNFAEYVTAKNLDTKLPLVCDRMGTGVNVSFQSVDVKTGEVDFYAPVFAGYDYKHARPIGNYVREFMPRMPNEAPGIAFSCNCILNYLHCELAGQKTGSITGPITFGEIAYQLLNQTMVYVNLVDLPRWRTPPVHGLDDGRILQTRLRSQLVRR